MLVNYIKTNHKHEMQKRPDKKPAADLRNVLVSSNPRRLPWALRKEIDSQINELREKEFI